MYLRLALNFNVVEDDFELLFLLAVPLKCWDYRHVGIVYSVLWIEYRALGLVSELVPLKYFSS